jgi:hypothetical protein
MDDNFFDLGGHSLLAVRLFADIENEFHKSISTAVILENPTIERLAEVIRTTKTGRNWKSLVPIRPSGSRSPIFLVHPAGGDIVSFKVWTQLIREDYPVYGLQAVIFDDDQPPLTRLEDIAERYLSEIRTIQPHGPYFIGGYCAGGVIAFEICQQLRAQGEPIGLLAIINQSPYDSNYYHARFSLSFIKGFLKNLPFWAEDFLRLNRNEMISRILTWSLQIRTRLTYLLGLSDINKDDFRKLEDRAVAIYLTKFPTAQRNQARAYFYAYLEAIKRYRSKPYPGKIHVFRTKRQPLICSFDETLGWSKLAGKGVKVLSIPGSTSTVFEAQSARMFTSLLEKELDTFYADKT